MCCSEIHSSPAHSSYLVFTQLFYRAGDIVQFIECLLNMGKYWGWSPVQDQTSEWHMPVISALGEKENQKFQVILCWPWSKFAAYLGCSLKALTVGQTKRILLRYLRVRNLVPGSGVCNICTRNTSFQSVYYQDQRLYDFSEEIH